MLGAMLQNHGHKLRPVALYDGESVPADLDGVDGILSMGGPMNVADTADHAWIEPELACLKAAHDAGLPVMGICLGAQLIAAALGGKVEAMSEPEDGWHEVTLAFPGTVDTLHAGITWKSMQVHLHGQQVTELPPGGVPLASSALCRTQAFKVGFTTYAFQYHFEWARPQIAHFTRDGHGEHYDAYRRRGDRLCEQIATYLFPVDKR